MAQSSYEDPRSLVVGFVGLGQQGGPMAANLIAAGYDVIVRDTDRERERQFVASHGGRGCDGDTAALGEAGVVFTMLPNGRVVRDALLGDAGIASRLRPGTIIVDTSSSDPYGTRELGAELAKLGLVLLDSPVTRPEAVGNDTRRITFMVAGDDDAIDRVMPLLQAMAELVFRVGELGCGHAIKTLNNYVSAAGLAAALDAMIVGQRFGVDVQTMLEVFNAGTARNFSTANTLVDEAMSRRYAAGFQLALMVKDLRIASALFEREGFDAPLSPLVRDQFAEALDRLDDQGADLSRSLEGWESRAGVTVPHPRQHAAASDEPPVLRSRTIGESWLAVAGRIVASGWPSVYDGLPIRELALITLEVTRPDPDDAIIAKHADPERLAWMHANFTDHERVASLGDADSYATRLFDYERSGRDQVRWVIDRLRADRSSRSATITTFQPHTDTTYIPCVSMLDFWLPDGALELVVYAHSIDFGAKGYANLVELASLQRHVAEELGVPVGRMLVIVKSAHVYETELDYIEGVLVGRST